MGKQPPRPPAAQHSRLTMRGVRNQTAFATRLTNAALKCGEYRVDMVAHRLGIPAPKLRLMMQGWLTWPRPIQRLIKINYGLDVPMNQRRKPGAGRRPRRLL